MVYDMLHWVGPGVGVPHQYNTTFNVVDSAEPNTCYKGESTVHTLPNVYNWHVFDLIATVQKLHNFLTSTSCTCYLSIPKGICIMYPN